MVTTITQNGLIVTTRSHTTPPLREMIECVGWPVLFEASARRLYHELEYGDPGYLLFWLDDRHDVATTVRLVTWLRERDPRRHRIVVIYHLENDLEPVIRAAGVHSYVPISSDIGATVQEALGPLLDFQRVAVPSHGRLRLGSEPLIRGPTNLSGFPAAVRPP